MEVGIAARKGSTALGWAVDKEVRLDVHIGLALRVAPHDIGTVRPVIDHVVGILVNALHLEVAGVVVAKEIANKRHIVGLHQSASRVGHQTLSDDAVL